MIRAFFVKDVRLAARAGAPIPGLTVLLVLQAVLCFACTSYLLLVGPIPASIWTAGVSLVGTVAFVLAFIGPGAAAATAAGAESNPDLAESLATSPLRPTEFLLGKAAVPALQGVALQLALLPCWAFLVGTGMLARGEAIRLLIPMFAAVPVSAIGGAARYGVLGTGRAAVVRAAAKRGLTGVSMAPPGQQTFLAMLGIAWMVQVFRGIGMSVPTFSHPLAQAAQDVLRPVLPILSFDRGGPVPVFGIMTPAVLLSIPLLGALGVLRLAAAVALSTRAGTKERERAWAAHLAARSLIVFYLAGATWSAGPAVSATVAGLAALLFALGGLPAQENRVHAAGAAALPCLLPMIATSLGAGFAGAACWIVLAAISASAGAALPPRVADSDRRTAAAMFVALAGVAAPLAAGTFSVPGGPFSLLEPLVPVIGAWTWVSLPAAVIAISSDLLGPIPVWSDMTRLAPVIVAVPAWIGAPALFAAVASIAVWRKRGAASGAASDSMNLRG